MTNRLVPRLVSFALATLVTWSLFLAIDTLALTEHSGAMPMAQAAAATQVATATAGAPRS
jgi:hypothetical protein